MIVILIRICELEEELLRRLAAVVVVGVIDLSGQIVLNVFLVGAGWLIVLQQRLLRRRVGMGRSFGDAISSPRRPKILLTIRGCQKALV